MVWKCPPLHLPNWNNLWKWNTEMVESPCTGNCRYDELYKSCADCGRTKEEISKWLTMTDDEKLAVLERLLNDAP